MSQGRLGLHAWIQKRCLYWRVPAHSTATGGGGRVLLIERGVGTHFPPEGPVQGADYSGSLLMKQLCSGGLTESHLQGWELQQESQRKQDKESPKPLKYKTMCIYTYLSIYLSVYLSIYLWASYCYETLLLPLALSRESLYAVCSAYPSSSLPGFVGGELESANSGGGLVYGDFRRYIGLYQVKYSGYMEICALRVKGQPPSSHYNQPSSTLIMRGTFLGICISKKATVLYHPWDKEESAVLRWRVQQT